MKWRNLVIGIALLALIGGGLFWGLNSRQDSGANNQNTQNPSGNNSLGQDISGTVIERDLACTEAESGNSCTGALVVKNDMGENYTVNVTHRTILPRRTLGSGKTDVDPPKLGEKVRVVLAEDGETAAEITRL